MRARTDHSSRVAAGLAGVPGRRATLRGPRRAGRHPGRGRLRPPSDRGSRPCSTRPRAARIAGSSSRSSPHRLLADRRRSAMQRVRPGAVGRGSRRADRHLRRRRGANRRRHRRYARRRHARQQPWPRPSTSWRGWTISLPALVRIARSEDVVITLGAGSIGAVPERLVDVEAGGIGLHPRDVRESSCRAFRSAISPRARSSRRGGAGYWRPVVMPLRAVDAGGAARPLRHRDARGSSVVAHARVLQIDHIVVRGNERLSKGEVLAVLERVAGRKPDVDRSRSRGAARLCWRPRGIRDAALRRSLPSIPSK